MRDWGGRTRRYSWVGSENDISEWLDALSNGTCADMSALTRIIDGQLPDADDDDEGGCAIQD